MNKDDGSGSTVLEFQDFDLTGSAGSTAGRSRDSTNNPPRDSALFDNEEDDGLVGGSMEHNKLLQDDSDESQTQTAQFWTVEYYRRWFNVSTSDVQHRCVGSMLPLPSANLLRDSLARRPDLYGPFWICVTVSLCVAVMSNVSSYIQTAVHGHHYHWHYDFHKLSVAASVLFCYSWLVPVAMTTLLWWRSVQTGVSLLSLISLYGYSLSVFVPVSMLCASGVWQIQYVSVIVGGVLSACVLALNMWRAVRQSDDTQSDTHRRTAAVLAVCVLCLHLLLSAVFLLYFFRAPSVGGDVQTAPSVGENFVVTNSVSPAANVAAAVSASQVQTIAGNISQTSPTGVHKTAPAALPEASRHKSTAQNVPPKAQPSDKTVTVNLAAQDTG